ncbi:MAG TPA: LacI family DNA-binding transcriptional regulator [Tepidisphaeraceae bacterium]|nr:LacI family DNA-binding transcriptional regulator [Tepidisphaeraceae bacterium]
MSIIRVARAAGVSHATVSNVINKRPHVTPETVEAVHRAMAELGYTPRPISSRPGRRPRSADGVYTGTVTLLCPRSEPTARRSQNPILIGVMQGAADELRGCALDLSVCFTEPGNVAETARAVERSDGLLVISFHERAVLDDLRAKPVVWIGSHGPTDWGDRVRTDHAQIARDAAAYLVGHGRSDLVYVNLDVPHPAYEQRRTAFRDETEHLDVRLTVIAPRPTPGLDPAASRDQRAAEAAALLKQMDLTRAGLFVACDRHLVILERECRRLGFDLMNEAPVISCDNDASALAGVVPAPATFDLQPEQLGRVAVQRLVGRMRGDAMPGQLTVAIPALPVNAGLPADLPISDGVVPMSLHNAG